ncbi:hypothetical protein LIA77_07255 [Sarocladium implicatum]|nr:hypothetical protein LIA77_07255 [Sarocladium implicatum]
MSGVISCNSLRSLSPRLVRVEVVVALRDSLGELIATIATPVMPDNDINIFLLCASIPKAATQKPFTHANEVIKILSVLCFLRPWNRGSPAPWLLIDSVTRI